MRTASSILRTALTSPSPIQALSKGFDPAAAAELAFVKYRQKNYGEASGLLKRALKTKSDLAIAHYYLGAVQFAQGDMKSARDSYLEADRLGDSTDPKALVGLCQVEAQDKAATLDETKKKISTRFAKDAAALLTNCVPQ